MLLWLLTSGNKYNDPIHGINCKKISLSLGMPYNHGEGNSYFGTVGMPGTLQPLSLLIFSKCYENINLDLYIVDRDHLKEIK